MACFVFVAGIFSEVTLCISTAANYRKSFIRRHRANVAFQFVKNNVVSATINVRGRDEKLCIKIELAESLSLVESFIRVNVTASYVFANINKLGR